MEKIDLYTHLYSNTHNWWQQNILSPDQQQTQGLLHCRYLQLVETDSSNACWDPYLESAS